MLVSHLEITVETQRITLQMAGDPRSPPKYEIVSRQWKYSKKWGSSDSPITLFGVCKLLLPLELLRLAFAPLWTTPSRCCSFHVLISPS